MPQLFNFQMVTLEFANRILMRIPPWHKTFYRSHNFVFMFRRPIVS